MAQQAPWLLILQSQLGGSPDYVLPDADSSIGRVIAVKSDVGRAGITVRAPHHQLIDDTATFDIASGEAGIFQARAGAWRVVGTYKIGGGGGAPTNSSYVVVGLDASLTADRRLQGTANQVILADGGPNADLVLSTPQNTHTAAEPTFAGMTLGTEEFITQATYPAQITATVNNYNPGNGYLFILDFNAEWSITGFAGGVDGRHMLLYNKSTFAAQISHLGFGSLAANKVICPRGFDFTLFADSGVELIYDGTAARWRLPEVANRIYSGPLFSVLLNVSGAELATGAITGFTHQATCNGTPTGVPTFHTGMAATIVDRANDLFYIYTNGAWHSMGGGVGTFSVTQATVDLPYPAKRSHRVTVVDAAVAALSKIIPVLAGVPDTQANAGDAVDLLSMQAVPAAGSFELQTNFLTPMAGPLVINYTFA